jgi:hypothetical protein
MTKESEFLRKLSRVVMEVKTIKPVNEKDYYNSTRAACAKYEILELSEALAQQDIVVKSIILICQIKVVDPVVCATAVNYYSKQAWEYFESKERKRLEIPPVEETPPER